MYIPESKEKEGTKCLFKEIITEKTSNIRKELNIEIWEADKTPIF